MRIYYHTIVKMSTIMRQVIVQSQIKVFATINIITDFLRKTPLM